MATKDTWTMTLSEIERELVRLQARRAKKAGALFDFPLDDEHAAPRMAKLLGNNDLPYAKSRREKSLKSASFMINHLAVLKRRKQGNPPQRSLNINLR